jgi:DNA repair protein SbcD/Mre11
VRWIHLPVPVDECSAAANAIDLVREAIEAAVAREAQGRLLICRVELTGQTRLHGELLSSAEHLRAEARASALGLGEEVAWIERLVIATASPEITASRKDALGELQRMMEITASDFELQAQLASDLGDLVRKLPHDIRAHSEDAGLRAAIDGNIAGLITHVGAYLSARLGAEKV